MRENRGTEREKQEAAQPVTHIFLTGDTQVGKSTIIRRWIAAHPTFRIGGFRTVAGPREPDGCDSIHIIPAAGKTPLTADNRVLRRGGDVWSHGRRVQPFLPVFDTVGAALLADPAAYDLILMDEVGIQEDGAEQFRRAVLACLDGEIPILGVVRDLPGTLTNAVRRHPNTRLVTVTVQNRTQLLPQLLAWPDGGAGTFSSPG